MFPANRPRLRLLFLSAASLGLSILAGCGREPAAKTPAAPPAPVTPPTVTAPLPPPTINRADLLRAIADARSAYASGQTASAESLTGRRFAVRQAFGCAGPAAAAPDGQARWTWDKAHKTIDIRLTPADWAHQPVMAGAGPDGAPWEAVEGIWLTRPWLLTDGCPAPPAAPPPSTDTPSTGAAPLALPAPVQPATTPTSGLAAVFEAGGSRLGRRDGRAYAFTVRGEPTAAPPASGYRLLIEGRLAAFPDGRAIRCRADSPDIEPLCLAAAQVDRVAIEDADGKLLREWR